MRRPGQTPRGIVNGLILGCFGVDMGGKSGTNSWRPASWPAAFIRLAAAFVLLVGGAPVAALADGQPYLLNPGDELEISVWKEEGLHRTVSVLPDGLISFPLAGHLPAAGRSAFELQDAIARSLSAYIPDPVVTVTVTEPAGNQIYVIGAVNKPGAFEAKRNLDIVQALSLAGGFSTFADTDDIIVLRREGGVSKSVSFRFSDVKNGRNLESNILLRAGDTVVVPD